MTDVRVRYTTSHRITVDDLTDVDLPQEVKDRLGKIMAARIEEMIFGSLSLTAGPICPRRGGARYIRHDVS